MSKEGKIARGKKWSMLAKLNDYNKVNVESDPNKMADVNFYLESIKEVDPEKVDVDWSSKTKAELIATAENLELDVSGAKTRDDLIVILEANSDSEPQEA